MPRSPVSLWVGSTPEPATSSRSFPRPAIGVAKRTLGAPVLNSRTAASRGLRLVVENFSLEALDAVASDDPLAGAAPGVRALCGRWGGSDADPRQLHHRNSSGIRGACAGGTANAAFDGDGDPVVGHHYVPGRSGPPVNSPSLCGSCPWCPPPLAATRTRQPSTARAPSPGPHPRIYPRTVPIRIPGGDDDPTNDNVPTPLTPTLIADVTTALAFPAGVDAGDPVAGTVVFDQRRPLPGRGRGLHPDPFPGPYRWDLPEPSSGRHGHLRCGHRRGDLHRNARHSPCRTDRLREWGTANQRPVHPTGYGHVSR